MLNVLSKEEYLYDPKIRSSFSLGQSINAIRLAQPKARIGLVELAPASSIDHTDCVFLSLCRARCDILIVGTLGKHSKEFDFLLASLSVVDYITNCDGKSWKENCDEINPHVIFFEKKHLEDLGEIDYGGRYRSTTIEVIDHPFQYED